jgi:PAS domain S-box-containing protein
MTERNPTEAPPRAPEVPGAHYRAAFENCHEAIVIVQDDRLKVANRSAARLSGYPIDDLIGKAFADLVHIDDQTRLRELYLVRLAGETSDRGSVLRIIRASGEVAWLEAHSTPTTWDGRPAVLVFIDDVTDREGARREAADAANRLQRISEIAPFFLFIYDYDLGRDVYINRSVPNALGFFGEEEAALQPYPFLKLCHPDDLGPALDRDDRWRGVESGTPKEVEFRLRHRTGDWRWFRSYNTPFLIDPDGRVRQMLGIAEDITERRRIEERMRRNERLESLGLLAGGIAHDFSNLLTPIVGHVELLLDRIPEDSALRDRAVAIETAALRASELARQLLVFAGRGEIERRPVDLSSLVKEVVHLYGSLSRDARSVALDLAERLPPISGDSSQLRQVILNLLTNAHDAVLDAGSDEVGRARGVSIATRATTLSPDAYDLLLLRDGLEPGPVVELVVEDEGAGMDSEALTRVGEPFFTTKSRGRGLGLPASLGILRAHRAGVALESRLGHGTRFHIYFPEAAPNL